MAEPLALDAIQARADEYAAASRALSAVLDDEALCATGAHDAAFARRDDAAQASAADVPALVAEVQRLRAFISDVAKIGEENHSYRRAGNDGRDAGMRAAREAPPFSGQPTPALPPDVAPKFEASWRLGFEYGWTDAAAHRDRDALAAKASDQPRKSPKGGA